MKCKAMATNTSGPKSGFRAKRRIQEHYQVVGFINSGTYGRVYKAEGIGARKGVFAIKKFKPDNPNPAAQTPAMAPTYTGISQSAIREMSLCAELRPQDHPNIIEFFETFLQDTSIYMIFGYCEHDLLQFIHHHSHTLSSRPLPASLLRSVIRQLLTGVLFLHRNWILHRDLKPANIMVTSAGTVRIGDLGLARIFRQPLVPLVQGDKVVVTIWYRAPELLLGAKHYTPAIDLWAVGCIFGELLALRPMFKGEEVKADQSNSQSHSHSHSHYMHHQQHAQQQSRNAAAGGGGGLGDRKIPFQKNQFEKIIKILSVPKASEWPLLSAHPEAGQMAHCPPGYRGMGLSNWWYDTITKMHKGYATKMGNAGKPNESGIETVAELGPTPSDAGLDALRLLLSYNPETRINAEDALKHAYFEEGDTEAEASNCFAGLGIKYPKRKITDSTGREAMGVANAPATGTAVTGTGNERKRAYEP